MAHFNFEKDLNSLLRCDSTITKGPMARWERKAMETSTPGNLSVNMSNLTINTSNASMGKTSSSKTPVKTPKLCADDKGKYLTPGKGKLTPGRKTPKTPTDPNCAGDRFIPNRSAMQLDIGHYVITKASSENSENLSPNSMRYRDAMSEQLNGDLTNFRVMAYQKKAPLAPTGHANVLKVLYSSCKNPGSTKRATRYIPQTPERILDAPEIIDDYYLNLIDWSASNLLAVGLSGGLYIWNATSGTIQHIMEIPDTGEYISSVSWLKEGNCLAVGTSMATIELWDVEAEKRIRVMKSHSARVCSLSWNSYILSSGSKSGHIHHHDVRIAEHHVGSLTGHSQEVCGLQWSPDGRYLASGGNDNILNIWACNMSIARADTQPVFTFNDHQAAVKAISWCPWQSNILASGGGTADRHIRFWNCNLGSCLNSINAKSQVCALLWSKEYKEIISGHGFANYELNIWKYPQMAKVAELTGHTSRILNLAMSPDGTTVISAGADETLRLWNCFAVDPKKKKVSSISLEKKSDMMKSSIR